MTDFIAYTNIWTYKSGSVGGIVCGNHN